MTTWLVDEKPLIYTVSVGEVAYMHEPNLAITAEEQHRRFMKDQDVSEHCFECAYRDLVSRRDEEKQRLLFSTFCQFRGGRCEIKERENWGSLAPASVEEIGLSPIAFDQRPISRDEEAFLDQLLSEEETQSNPTYGSW